MGREPTQLGNIESRADVLDFAAHGSALARVHAAPSLLTGSGAFSPDGSRMILLTRGYVTVVNESDFEELSKVRWYAATTHKGTKICACREVNGKSVLMHRAILDALHGVEVDHRDGNTLNNRRSNLRLATHSQNLANRRNRSPLHLGFKGVYHKRVSRWGASIKVDGKCIHLGYRSSPDECARLYDRAAIEHFGEFACTNVMLGLLPPLEVQEVA